MLFVYFCQPILSLLRSLFLFDSSVNRSLARAAIFLNYTHTPRHILIVIHKTNEAERTDSKNNKTKKRKKVRDRAMCVQHSFERSNKKRQKREETITFFSLHFFHSALLFCALDTNCCWSSYAGGDCYCKQYTEFG